MGRRPQSKGRAEAGWRHCRLTGAAIEVSPGCCGESGMGAIASPLVYNTLRKRKMDVLEAALADYPAQSPILVGCPSCKVGITRSLMAMHERRPVLHTVEWLATLLFRERWGEKWIRVFRRRIAPSAGCAGRADCRIGWMTSLRRFRTRQDKGARSGQVRRGSSDLVI